MIHVWGLLPVNHTLIKMTNYSATRIKKIILVFEFGFIDLYKKLYIKKMSITMVVL